MRISDWSSDVCLPISSPACRFARGGGLDDLAADRLGFRRTFEQEFQELLGNDFLYRRPRFAGDQLHLSLRREFWIRHLDRQYASQALAHVVTGDIDFRALGVIVLLDELVDDTRHRRAQSGQRSEEHTSELQSLMRISYAAF